MSNGYLRKYVQENMDCPIQDVLLDEELLEELTKDDDNFFE